MTDENFNSTFLATGSLLKKSIDVKSTSDRIIKGYCSIPVVDLENEIISTSAYNSAIKTVKDRTQKGRSIPIFIEHRRKELSLPVGSVVDAGQDEKGLWFKGKIAKGNIGDSVWDLISQNMLYSVSMGGDATKKSRKYDNKLGKDITVIDDLTWRELSLTGLPVNEEAVFSVAKSMDISKKERTKFTMGVEKSLKKLNSAIDFEKSLHSIQKTNMALEKAINGNEDLSEDQLNKIADSMRTLARLLGIPSDFSGDGTEQPPVEEQEQSTEEINPEKIVSEEAASEEIAPEENITSEQPIEEKPAFGNKKKLNTPDKKIISEKEVSETPEEEVIEEETVENKDKKQNPFAKKKKKEVPMDEDNEDGKAIDSDEMDIQKEDDSEDVGGDRLLSLEKKVDEIHRKLIKGKGGEKEMEEKLVKCDGCGTSFEKSEYDVNYCPKCGTELLKSEDESEEEEEEEEDKESGEEKNEDLEKCEHTDENEDNVEEDDYMFCKACDSFFEKNLGYEMSYCPKCGKSVVAVAPSPAGADTKYDGQKEGAKNPDKVDDLGGKGTQAVAENPKGASTKWKKAQKKLSMQKNLTIDNPEKTSAASVDAFEGGEYVDSITREQEYTGENSTLHDHKGPEFQPFAGKIDEGKAKTYGVAKSTDSRLDRIEKALESIASESVGKKSKVDTKIEKTKDTGVDANRFLAKTFLGTI